MIFFLNHRSTSVLTGYMREGACFDVVSIFSNKVQLSLVSISCVACAGIATRFGVHNHDVNGRDFIEARVV